MLYPAAHQTFRLMSPGRVVVPSLYFNTAATLLAESSSILTFQA